jgi:hypothetical protein
MLQGFDFLNLLNKGFLKFDASAMGIAEAGFSLASAFFPPKAGNLETNADASCENSFPLRVSVILKT